MQHIMNPDTLRYDLIFPREPFEMFGFEVPKWLKLSIDTLSWITLTSCVGFAQVIIHFMVSKLNNNIGFNLTDFLENGVMFSFCFGIVASIFFDAHYQKKHSGEITIAYLEDLSFKLFPWVVVGVLCVITPLELTSKDEDIDKSMFITTQILMIVTSFVYAGYYKYTQFVVGYSDE